MVDAPGGPRPYNDYDLVLVHRVRDRARLERALDAVHREHGRRCGIHVDVTPIARARVPRLPAALTWYEFGVGHRLVWGDASVLDPLRHRRLEDVHPSEWGRLLTNRACGLVFARRVLAGEPCGLLDDEPADAFVERQLRKAWLAFGDVRLADAGRYHPLARQRLAAAQDGVLAPAWLQAYVDAVGFKMRPKPPRPRPDLQADLARLAPLVAEDLGRRRAATARPLYGLLCTARFLPPRRWLSSAPWRYPRDRVRLACAAELLGDSAARDRWCGSAAGFERLWSRFG